MISTTLCLMRGHVEEYRWLDDGVYVDSDVKVIYGNRVAYLMSWFSTYKIIVIEDSRIAEENKRLFNYIWKKSESPSTNTAPVSERYVGVGS